MAGKASGRTRAAGGVYGRFSDTWRGWTAAELWRDGMTQRDPADRDAWWIGQRGGYVWSLPPGGMAERAAADPSWVPSWPFDLEPMETKIRLVAEAEAAGLPAPGRVPPPWPPAKPTKETI